MVEGGGCVVFCLFVCFVVGFGFGFVFLFLFLFYFPQQTKEKSQEVPDALLDKCCIKWKDCSWLESALLQASTAHTQIFVR